MVVGSWTEEAEFPVGAQNQALALDCRAEHQISNQPAACPSVSGASMVLICASLFQHNLCMQL